MGIKGDERIEDGLLVSEQPGEWWSPLLWPGILGEDQILEKQSSVVNLIGGRDLRVLCEEMTSKLLDRHQHEWTYI